MLKEQKIYFIGAGGIGASRLIEYAHYMGCDVRGSDSSSNMIAYNIPLDLQSVVTTREIADNITPDLDLVVYSEAILPTHPELQRARELNIPTIVRHEFLAELLQDYSSVVGIVGSTAKSTVTTYVGAVLEKLNPAVLVGNPNEMLSRSAIRDSSTIAVELCEYPTLEPYTVDVCVLTNIFWRHLQWFPSKEKYLQAYEKFLQEQVKLLIWNRDCPESTRIVQKLIGVNQVSCGFHEESDYHIGYSGGNSFTLNGQSYNVQDFNVLPIKSSIHNLSMALATANMMNTEPVVDQLRVVDRLEVLWRKPYLAVAAKMVFPEEINSTVDSLRQQYNRVVVIYKPYVTSRIQLQLDRYLEALSLANDVFFISAYKDDSPLDFDYIESYLANYRDSSVDQRFLAEGLGESDVIVFASARESGCLNESIELLRPPKSHYADRSV